MKNNEKKGRGMINFFSDASDTDYDRAIEQTKDRMKECDPCEGTREMDSLIVRLKQFKNTYYTRPCIEGYCFGIFTPHTSRITRRINAFAEERKIHEEECKDYTREKEQNRELKNKLSMREAELEHETKIKKYEIDAMKEVVERTITTTENERKGIPHPRK